jgi:ketosteroid isomerase-like protein
VSQTTIPVPANLSAALERVKHALGAMGGGEPAPYAALWRDDDDVTLFGAWGSIERGQETVTTTFSWVGSRFAGGPLVPDDHVVAWSGDLAYTVGFERGRVRIDGGEPFDMTIRVTHVLRRADGEWWLVHRHADFPPIDQRTTAS